MSVECQVHVKSQSELDIGGRETCFLLIYLRDFTGTSRISTLCELMVLTEL